MTHDLDFGSILAATHGRKPSVVQIRTEEVSPGMIGKQVVAALRHTEPELAAGALLTIELDRTRLRLLPLETRDGSLNPPRLPETAESARCSIKRICYALQARPQSGRLYA